MLNKAIENQNFLFMVINLSAAHSLLNTWVAELRHTEIQSDRMRFRRNLERIGEVIAYEISKEMEWEEKENSTGQTELFG